METAARSSPARRTLRYLVAYAPYFAVLFGVYEFLDYLWPLHESVWRLATPAAILSAIFAAKYPLENFRRAKLGGTPPS
jgi:hypothetical protein